MSRRLCFFVTLFLSVANFASAQVTVTTNPVGFTTTTLLGSSDTFVSFTPSTSPPTYTTLLQVPDYSAPTYNSPYATQYYFDGSSSSWHRINSRGGDGGVGDDDPLLPDGYFVVHNGNKAPTRLLTN